MPSPVGGVAEGAGGAACDALGRGVADAFPDGAGKALAGGRTAEAAGETFPVTHAGRSSHPNHPAATKPPATESRPNAITTQRPRRRPERHGNGSSTVSARLGGNALGRGPMSIGATGTGCENRGTGAGAGSRVTGGSEGDGGTDAGADSNGAARGGGAEAVRRSGGGGGSERPARTGGGGGSERPVRTGGGGGVEPPTRTGGGEEGDGAGNQDEPTGTSCLRARSMASSATRATAASWLSERGTTSTLPGGNPLSSRRCSGLAPSTAVGLPPARATSRESWMSCMSGPDTAMRSGRIDSIRTGAAACPATCTASPYCRSAWAKTSVRLPSTPIRTTVGGLLVSGGGLALVAKSNSGVTRGT